MARQSLAGKTVVITGAGRGLGLALTRHLVHLEARVLAAVRDVPKSEKQLHSLGSDVLVTQLDVGSSQSVEAWAQRLAQSVDHVDIVINNAGTMDRSTVADATPDAMMSLFQINTVGPMMVVQSLLRHGLLGPPETLVVNISSLLGSIGDDRLDDFSNLPYRCSKSALNMLSKRMDIELQQGSRARCIAVHPGAVQTDMSGGKGALTPDESAAAILALLQQQDGVQGGKFYSFDGSEIEW